MTEHRWSKFWWQDWQRDPALRSCGLAARGLWIDQLCIMNEGSPTGHLTINGLPPTPRRIGIIVGCSERDATKYLKELEEAGVFSRTIDGVIYSRRMVRDKASSELFAKYGKRGGNPALKPHDNGTLNGGGNPGGLSPPLIHQEADSEAESEAEAEKKENTPKPPRPARTAKSSAGADGEFGLFWNGYPRKVGKGAARTAWAKATKKSSGTEILTGLDNAKWPTDPQYIPHPAKWLNHERWLDVVDTRDPVLVAVGYFDKPDPAPGSAPLLRLVE